MSAKSRVTRKELLKKPDGFLVLTQNVVDSFKRNQKIVLSIVLALAISAGVYGIYFYRRVSNHQQALLLEQEGNHLFSTLEKEDISDTEEGNKIKKTLDKYREIIHNYPGTQSAERALIYIADCYYRLKQFNRAKESYFKYLGKHPQNGFFTLAANQSLGYVYEAQGDYEKAIQYFLAASGDSPDRERLQTFMDVARCYEVMGKLELAVEYYQRAVQNAESKEGDRNIRFGGGMFDLERVKGKIARLQSL